MQVLLSSAKVCELAGITWPQLDHWCRTGRIPGQEDSVGRGQARCFTDEQVAFVMRLAAATRIRSLRTSQLVAALAEGHCPFCGQAVA